MQENMLVKETYFGPDVIERIKNLLETVIFTTNLKNNNTYNVKMLII